MAVAVGYVNSIGRNLPVLMDVNLIPTGATLADGRPIYSTAVSAATRVDPTFNHINVFQSIGESTYNAFTATLTKRMTHGWQAQATYTLARGVDNAPLTGTYVVGSGDDRVSDPSNLDRDKGVTPFNQTHTFSVSTVIAPQVVGDRHRRGAAEQQPARHHPPGEQRPAVQHPLEPRPERATASTTTGRSASSATPAVSARVVNLDLRYSRFVPLSRRSALELFFEAKNLFNTAEHRRREPRRDDRRRRRTRQPRS